MKLADNEILASLEEGRIRIVPNPEPDCINGASIDLRLGSSFRAFSNHSCSHIDLGMSRAEIDSAIQRSMDNHIELKEGEVFYLHPGELALGATLERVELSEDICGTINGRSSFARLGLMVHSTAHFVDPGWQGQIVLEFYNCGRQPLGLRPGLAICAIAFEPLTSPAKRSYSSRTNAKYLGQVDATLSRISQERF